MGNERETFLPHPDKDLATRILAGDESAFDSFFETNFDGLFRFALQRTRGDESLAEEIVQATLCQAITKLDTYRGQAPIFSWLCTFCRHEISAHYRRAGREPVGLDLPGETAEVVTALSRLWEIEGEGPEAAFERGEIAGIVRSTLDSLQGSYGRVLEWKYMEGIPVNEIAERLGLSPKAAESQLTRAREAFRVSFSVAMRGREGAARARGGSSA